MASIWSYWGCNILSSPFLIAQTIRDNIRFEGETEFKKWDSLPLDVRKILKESAKFLEEQDKLIDQLHTKNIVLEYKLKKTEFHKERLIKILEKEMDMLLSTNNFRDCSGFAMCATFIRNCLDNDFNDLRGDR